MQMEASFSYTDHWSTFWFDREDETGRYLFELIGSGRLLTIWTCRKARESSVASNSPGRAGRWTF
jgi:hypothetical protein